MVCNPSHFDILLACANLCQGIFCTSWFWPTFTISWSFVLKGITSCLRRINLYWFKTKIFLFLIEFYHLPCSQSPKIQYQYDILAPNVGLNLHQQKKLRFKLKKNIYKYSYFCKRCKNQSFQVGLGLPAEGGRIQQAVGNFEKSERYSTLEVTQFLQISTLCRRKHSCG